LFEKEDKLFQLLGQPDLYPLPFFDLFFFFLPDPESKSGRTANWGQFYEIALAIIYKQQCYFIITEILVQSFWMMFYPLSLFR
jgi:hypothetical protein